MITSPQPTSAAPAVLCQASAAHTTPLPSHTPSAPEAPPPRPSPLQAAQLGEAAMDFYFCTLSNRTIVYKGMLRSAVVGAFYKDLVNEAYETAFAIYHRRFSTNTTPKWPLAQPMRFLGHNGEINTLQVGGTTASMQACRFTGSFALLDLAPAVLLLHWHRAAGCCSLDTAATHNWHLVHPAEHIPPASPACRATSTGWPPVSMS
jgi:hypothetical protein